MKTALMLTALMYSLGGLIKKDEVNVAVDSEKIANGMERQRVLSKDHSVSKKDQKKMLGKSNRKNRGRKR